MEKHDHAGLQPESQTHRSHLLPTGYLFIILMTSAVLCQSCTSHRRRTHEEAYTVIEQQSITLTYLVDGHSIYYKRTPGASLLGINPKIRVYCTVTNTSEHGGIFKLYGTLTSQGNSLDFSDEGYIGAGSTIELSEEKEINPYSFETNVQVGNWGIIPPTVSVDVPVTKYRSVEDD
jgi:hypothetical protein